MTNGRNITKLLIIAFIACICDQSAKAQQRAGTKPVDIYSRERAASLGRPAQITFVTGKELASPLVYVPNSLDCSGVFLDTLRTFRLSNGVTAQVSQTSLSSIEVHQSPDLDDNTV